MPPATGRTDGQPSHPTLGHENRRAGPVPLPAPPLWRMAHTSPGQHSTLVLVACAWVSQPPRHKSSRAGAGPAPRQLQHWVRKPRQGQPTPAATQAKIPGLEVAHTNIYHIHTRTTRLCEGAAPTDKSCRIPMTQGSNKIAKRSPYEDPVFTQ